jgi:hypothetical protein
MTLGATIPCDHSENPDFSMYDSVKQADDYIKEWKHLIKKSPTTKLSAGEWVGFIILSRL